MDIGKKKVSFPMVANYNSVGRYFVDAVWTRSLSCRRR